MQFILYTNHTFCDHDIIVTIAQKLAPASSFSKATRKFVKCSGSPRKLQPQDTQETYKCHRKMSTLTQKLGQGNHRQTFANQNLFKTAINTVHSWTIDLLHSALFWSCKDMTRTLAR